MYFTCNKGRLQISRHRFMTELFSLAQVLLLLKTWRSTIAINSSFFWITSLNDVTKCHSLTWLWKFSHLRLPVILLLHNPCCYNTALWDVMRVETLSSVLYHLCRVLEYLRNSKWNAYFNVEPREQKYSLCGFMLAVLAYPGISENIRLLPHGHDQGKPVVALMSRLTFALTISGLGTKCWRTDTGRRQRLNKPPAWLSAHNRHSDRSDHKTKSPSSHLECLNSFEIKKSELFDIFLWHIKEIWCDWTKHGTCKQNSTRKDIVKGHFHMFEKHLIYCLAESQMSGLY